jgi:transcriptional regulator with XRE-family HTH domain
MSEQRIEKSQDVRVPLPEPVRNLRRRLGRQIWKLRRERGLTQEELAQLLIVPRLRLGKWEAGYNAPPLEDLVALSKVLGVTTDELLTGNQPFRPQRDLDQELGEKLASLLNAILDLLK